MAEARRKLSPWERVSKLLDEMCLDESLSTHLSKTQTESGETKEEIREVRKQVDAWVEEDAEAGFDVLFVAADVLDFEMNRIYKFWYGTEPEFPPKPTQKDEPTLDERLVKIFRDKPDDGGVVRLKELWTEYRAMGIAEDWFTP